MSTDTEFNPKETLSGLQSSLQDLNAAFEPLFSEPWETRMDKLDTLGRAKMDVLMAYAINDLIWVYLKTRGIDPSTHDVSIELERIKKYYAKIKSAENPETRKYSLDKAAAARFIKASIPRSQIIPPAPPSTSGASRQKREAEEAEMMHLNSDRSFMADRFRFLGDSDGVEKVLGTGGDGGGLGDVELGNEGRVGEEEGEDEEEDGDVEMDEEQILAMGGGEAEDLLRQVEDGLQQQTNPLETAEGKRKRAEDF